LNIGDPERKIKGVERGETNIEIDIWIACVRENCIGGGDN